MCRFMAQILSVISVIVLFVLVLIFAANDNQTAMYISMAVWFVIYLVLGHFQRCPHCGAWPRKGSLFNQYCPQCGGTLNDE